MNEKKEIFMIANTSKIIFYFRRELILDLLKRGYSVSCICGDNSFQKEIEKLGVRFLYCALKSRSINLFESLKYQRFVKKILKKEKPNTVISFMIKPSIFGSIAAKKARIKNIYSMVEGLGDGFSNESFSNKVVGLVLSFLLRKGLSKCDKVFVLNKEDISFLCSKRIVHKEQCVLINGTGIDIDEYPYSKIENYNSVVMITRLIKAKGVFDYCEAACLCKQINPNLSFTLIGYESDITKKDLLPYIDRGVINYLGVVPDLHHVLKNMCVFVLPTYYNEGFPRSILEAMSTGRPVITTNSKGCNVAVVNEKTGLFVAEKNPKELCDAIIRVTGNKKLADSFGRAGRKRVEEMFISKNLNNVIIDILEKGE